MLDSYVITNHGGGFNMTTTQLDGTVLQGSDDGGAGNNIDGVVDATNGGTI